ncbi:DNA ligase 1 [Sesamum angolense]|uniref:DNA ligase 1 n=1 Tax=Sesamum angolense TaxID=2727404 RepID=A0AAE1XB28_9LAMI|nr:DNA ligase 1 [Sesamum angolense]
MESKVPNPTQYAAFSPWPPKQGYYSISAPGKETHNSFRAISVSSLRLMFSLRSCSHRSVLVSLSLNLTGKRPFSPSVSFSLKPSFLFVSSSPSLRTMSTSRPSAFDILMSNASKKKKNPSQSQPAKSQESSPRKRKSPVEISQTPNLNPIDNSQSKLSNPIENAAGEDQESAKNSTLDQIGDGNVDSSLKNSSDGTRSPIPAEEARLPGGTKKLKDSSSKQTGSKRADPSDGSVVAKKPRLSITPEESLAELKKKAANFNVKKAAYWGEGERVPFMFVVKALDAISKESGRIAITEIVCNMLRTVIETTPDDLLAVVYLLANRIASAHDGLELGIGDASIIKALAEACGTKEAHVKKQYKELGDLGLVAKASRSSQPLMRKPEALSVAKVFDTFRLIAKESGKDSQEKKKNHIKALLVAASDCEPQYLIRLLQTKLRIGLAEQTLLAALGHAAVYSEKHSSPPAKVDNPLEEAAKIVKQVYSVIPVYDKIVPALLSGGVWNLPKTCSFSPGIPVGPMLAKPTKGVSEIVEKFQDMEFTCEYKYDGERAQIHYMENGSVEIYSRNAERNTGKFPDVVVAVTSCEGLIIKTLKKDATYEPSKRSNNWLKLKKDYMDSIGDSIDLVPIAAFHGRGKRTGVYGAFLLACYDSVKEEFQSICKIGTGFSEAMLEERSASLRSKVIPKPKVADMYNAQKHNHKDNKDENEDD